MKLSDAPPQFSSEYLQIEQAEPGRLLVNGVAYAAPILLRADSIIATGVITLNAWNPQEVLPHVAKAVSEGALLLIGTGSSLHYPSDDQLAYFHDLHLPVEAMTTPAALRTLTALWQDGRPTWAWLHP